MRFLILSDSPGLNTGYGQNTYNLLNELDQLGHEVAAMGLGHAGEPVRYKGLDIYPGATPFMLQKSIAKFHPDVMMHIRDNWIFIPKYVPTPYSLIGMCHQLGVHLINYTPVQATPLPPEFVETIDKQADFTYVTNQVGVDALIKQGAPKDRVGCLYNGVDPGMFRTFPTDRKGTGLPTDKKMAIFVGANMDYRKAIPLSMMAFRKYLSPGWTFENPTEQTRSDAILYLHTNPYGGFDLPLFVTNLGLEKSCFLKSGEGMKLMTWDLTTAEMATMYNLGDAFISCTAAEGFNEPLLEALACGLPAVVTDTPIHREIFSCFGDRAQFIKATATLPTVWTFEHAADPDDAAEKLAKAFDMGKKEINMRLYPQFSWKRLAQQLAEQAEKIRTMPILDPRQEQLEAMRKALAQAEKQIEEEASKKMLPTNEPGPVTPSVGPRESQGIPAGQVPIKE
jgi:glycosyltransferase involved in cell wall biosynthesis